MEINKKIKILLLLLLPVWVNAQSPVTVTDSAAPSLSRTPGLSRHLAKINLTSFIGSDFEFAWEYLLFKQHGSLQVTANLRNVVDAYDFYDWRELHGFRMSVSLRYYLAPMEQWKYKSFYHIFRGLYTGPVVMGGFQRGVYESYSSPLWIASERYGVADELMAGWQAGLQVKFLKAMYAEVYGGALYSFHLPHNMLPYSTWSVYFGPGSKGLKPLGGIRLGVRF